MTTFIAEERALLRKLGIHVWKDYNLKEIVEHLPVQKIDLTSGPLNILLDFGSELRCLNSQGIFFDGVSAMVLPEFVLLGLLQNVQTLLKDK